MERTISPGHDAQKASPGDNPVGSQTETTAKSYTRPILPSDSCLPIRTIRIAVHSIGLFFDSDTRSGNHVSIYLLIGNGASIRLDMFKASSTDTIGTYRVRWCEYEVSRRAVKVFDMKSADGLIVGNVLDMIEKEGRGRYLLAKNGLGCRFWVITILDDLEKYGYISPDSPLSTASVKESMQYNYSKHTEPVLDEIVKGTFI